MSQNPQRSQECWNPAHVYLYLKINTLVDSSAELQSMSKYLS